METYNSNYIKQICNTMLNQIIAGTSADTFLSWGCDRITMLVYNLEPTLSLHVNGLLFHGYVLVSLNASDTYDVRLVSDIDNDDDINVIKSVNDVYCDNLARIIDENVERDPAWTDAEYSSRIQLAEIALDA